MFQSWLINSGIQAIMLAIKNPDKRLKLRAVMLELSNAIKFAYAEDPDFE